MKWVFIVLIRFYRRFISPVLPPSCRFSPTCSQYGLDAFRIHGAIKGFILTSWRILRCAPWSKGGWDPAPPAGFWRNPPNRVDAAADGARSAEVLTSFELTEKKETDTE